MDAHACTIASPTTGSNTPVTKCDAECQLGTQSAYNDAKTFKDHFQNIANGLAEWSSSAWENVLLAWLGGMLGAIIAGLLSALSLLASFAQDLANAFANEVKHGIDWFTEDNIVAAGNK